MQDQPDHPRLVMNRPPNPLKTTLLGGAVFLLPLVLVVVVLGHGLRWTMSVARPVLDVLPSKSIGGVTLATLAALVLLLLVCFAAGLLARAAFMQRLTADVEDKLQTFYPRYTVIKAMSQDLQKSDGPRLLTPVLATFDDHQLVAFEVERLPDGRVVLFLPGAPDAWAGSVALVAADRVAPLSAEVTDVTRTLRGLGRGTRALLATATPAASATAAGA